MHITSILPLTIAKCHLLIYKNKQTNKNRKSLFYLVLGTFSVFALFWVPVTFVPWRTECFQSTFLQTPKIYQTVLGQILVACAKLWHYLWIQIIVTVFMIKHPTHYLPDCHNFSDMIERVWWPHQPILSGLWDAPHWDQWTYGWSRSSGSHKPDLFL